MGQEPRRPSRGIAFSNWLVSRTSRALERGTSRRGFLIGSAMVGSAVAVAGVDYATRPSTAYAAIVPGGCAGGQCTDGYTEFCCAINNGINACPPNTFAGGWWRADSSSFCGGGTRYYIDCMQNCCGSSTNYCQNGYCFCESCVECQCAGDCNTRRVYCNYFRYGQCHTEIAISGPIACRVVSCTPPYAVAEYACLSSPAVDNSTAEHAANCAVNVEPTSTAAVLPASGMATTTGPGRVSLFVRGGGAAVYVRDFIDPNWTPFALVGGVITSGIAAAAGNGLEYVLARGGDNAIWGNRRAGGPGNPWSGWHTVGGAIRSDPVAVATGSDVFVLGRGLDDGAYVNRFNGTAWLGYTALGGKIDSEPVAVAYQSGVMVVARGIDGMLYANRFTGLVVRLGRNRDPRHLGSSLRSGCQWCARVRARHQQFHPYRDVRRLVVGLGLVGGHGDLRPDRGSGHDGRARRCPGWWERTVAQPHRQRLTLRMDIDGRRGICGSGHRRRWRSVIRVRAGRRRRDVVRHGGGIGLLGLAAARRRRRPDSGILRCRGEQCSGWRPRRRRS